jgi:hypothetical protein
VQYLTYEEYKEIGGGALDLATFSRNIDRACGFVDLHTQKRLQGVTEVSQRVMACVRDLVEYLANNSVFEKTITSKSQSAGGVSESESYVAKTQDEANAEMLNIVYDYLATETDDCGTPLMYRGAMR